MRNLIKDNFTLLKKCGKTLVFFEIVYKSLAIAVFYPLFLALFNLTLKCTGIKYLTNGYIPKYLLSPVTILALLLIVFVVSVYNFFEKCCISVLLEMAEWGEKISLISMFCGGYRSFRRGFHRKNLLVFVYEIFLFPFSNIIVLGLSLINLSLPEYITNAFGSRNKMYIYLALICMLLFVFAIRQIFTTNYIIYDNGNFKTACRNSALLIRKRMVRTLLLMLFWNAIVGIFVAFVFLVITGIVVGGVLLLNFTHVGIALYLTVLKTAKTIITLILVMISAPMSYMIITSMFFRFRRENGDEALETGMSEVTAALLEKPAQWKRGLRFGVTAATLISAALICVYVFRAMVSNPFDRVELLQIPEITAHRGSSMAAPENTMAAFEQAIADMADYIELDVHTTADGVVVVLHDNSLKRTTGLSRNIWQTSYSVVQKLDAGSWFDEEFEGEPVPSLEQVIQQVGDRVKLNIEIKYNKREPYLVERVVELIEKYELEERCIVTSSDYSVLKDVKLLNSDIKTGYVLSAAYGTYYTISYVDVISINYSFVNKATVDAIHNNGKEIHVWTVNSPSHIRALANMGVDNIITDDPVTAREIIYSRYTVRELVNILGYVFTRNGY